MTTVHVASESALLVVDDAAPAGDHPPTAERTLDGYRLEHVVCDPRRPDRVLVGTFESGLQRSLDGGETWGRVGTEIEEDAVMSLAVAPEDPDTLYAGTEPSAVYRSTDGGDSWTRLDGLLDLPSSSTWSFPPRPDTHHARWIEPDPHDPDHLYVGIEAGALVQTHDGGETWEDRVESARIDNHTLATHPDAPRRAWSAAGDGYAETTDGGDAWSHPQDGLDHRYCWSVAVDPGDPETVLVSAATGARTAHSTPGESYVYRKRSGDGWERITSGTLPTGEGVLRAVIEAGADAGEFWAANDLGLFHTGDAGDSWTEIDCDWPDEFPTRTVRGVAVVPEV